MNSDKCACHRGARSIGGRPQVHVLFGELGRRRNRQVEPDVPLYLRLRRKIVGAAPDMTPAAKLGYSRLDETNQNKHYGVSECSGLYLYRLNSAVLNRFEQAFKARNELL